MSSSAILLLLLWQRETLVDPLAWQRDKSPNVNQPGRVCHGLVPPVGSTPGPGVGIALEQPSDS